LTASAAKTVTVMVYCAGTDLESEGNGDLDLEAMARLPERQRAHTWITAGTFRWQEQVVKSSTNERFA
jgi:hypothetical protein